MKPGVIPGQTDSAALADLVRELADRVATLEAVVHTLRSPQAEPAPDAHFLSIVARATGGRVFSTAELRQHAAVDPPLATVLRPYGSNRRLGLYLRSLVGRRLGAFELQHVSRDEHGRLWTVVLLME